MVNNNDFSTRLKKVMNYFDYSAASFAEKIDIPRSSISHILSGRNKPSLDFVLKVTTNFREVDLYWLLNGKGTFPKPGSSSSKPSSSSTSPLIENEHQTNLFSNSDVSFHTQAETASNEEFNPSSAKNASKEIDTIVVFYKDGTFRRFRE